MKTAQRNGLVACLTVMTYVATCSGCFGAGHALVTLPPLRVTGQVNDAQGKPVGNRPFSIIVANVNEKSDAINRAVNRTATPSGAKHKTVLEVITDDNGQFSFSVRDRQYNHSAVVVGFFVVGGGTAKDVYIVLSEKEVDTPIYLVQLHHRRLILKRVDETTQELMPLNKIGTKSEISGKAKRSSKEDLVTLTLTVR